MTDAEIDKLDGDELLFSFRKHVVASEHRCRPFWSLDLILEYLPENWDVSIFKEGRRYLFWACTVSPPFDQLKGDRDSFAVSKKPTTAVMRAALKLAMKLKEST